MTYADAGVSVDRGNALARTLTSEALDSSLAGGFGGALPFKGGHLVAGTDGVGTKLEIAQSLNIHSSVGIDLVAMCANDVAVTGASPLFFLDYLSTGQLDVDVARSVVSGVQHGCSLANCSLLGGETAEMPGFYSPGQYDAAGFCVGFAGAGELLDPDSSSVQPGDAVVGLPSTGIHANGMSLARKAAQRAGISLEEHVPELGRTLGEELLEPTAMYVRSVRRVSGLVHAAAHITGGGLVDNIPRALPSHLGVQLSSSTWETPAVFRLVQQAGGGIGDAELRRTFNMGIGLVLIAGSGDVARVVSELEQEEARVIGQVVSCDEQSGSQEARVRFD